MSILSEMALLGNNLKPHTTSAVDGMSIHLCTKSKMANQEVKHGRKYKQRLVLPLV